MRQDDAARRAALVAAVDGFCDLFRTVHKCNYWVGTDSQGEAVECSLCVRLQVLEHDVGVATKALLRDLAAAEARLAAQEYVPRSRLEGERDAARAEYDACLTTWNECRQRLRDAEAERDAARMAAHELRETLHEQIDDLVNQTASLREERDAARAERDKHKTDYDHVVALQDETIAIKTDYITRLRQRIEAAERLRAVVEKNAYTPALRDALAAFDATATESK